MCLRQNRIKLKLSDLSDTVKLLTKERGIQMDNLLIENVTAQKCVVCSDLLTDWEETYCIMCEPEED